MAFPGFVLHIKLGHFIIAQWLFVQEKFVNQQLLITSHFLEVNPHVKDYMKDDKI